MIAAVVVLLLATALLRLAYLSSTPGYVATGDARDYDLHAQSIAVSGGFSKTLAYGRRPRPPARLSRTSWPACTAWPASSAPSARAASTSPASRRSTSGHSSSRSSGCSPPSWRAPSRGSFALALGAVYVPLITVGGSVMSEPLFDVFMLASLCAAVAHRRSAHRWRWALLAGVFAGLAILTRANALVLLLPLGLAVWDGRPRLSRAALGPPVVLRLVALLVVAPWTVRNARQFHAFIPVSTQLGSALAGTYNDDARHDRRDPASWRSLRRVADYMPLFRQVRTTPSAVLEKQLRAASKDYIRAHPGYVATVAWWSTRRMLDLGREHRWRNTAAVIGISRAWADRGVVAFWLLALLAIAGAFTKAARRTPFFVWLVPVLMYLSVVFLVVETPRYRTPIDPFVVILAAMALGALAYRVNEPRRSR